MRIAIIFAKISHYVANAFVSFFWNLAILFSNSSLGSEKLKQNRHSPKIAPVMKIGLMHGLLCESRPGVDNLGSSSAMRRETRVEHHEMKQNARGPELLVTGMKT